MNFKKFTSAVTAILCLIILRQTMDGLSAGHAGKRRGRSLLI